MSALSPPNFWGARVLVIEPDRARREKVLEGLVNFGFVMFEAESMGQALSFIDQEMDAVVFDLAVFGDGAINLIEEWQRRKAKTKIVVCGFEPKEHIHILGRGVDVAFCHLMQISGLVTSIQRALHRNLEDFDYSKDIPSGYTLESAKALMEQGKQEHEEGKLTWAADAWEISNQKWKEEIERYLISNQKLKEKIERYLKGPLR